jgi:hypothetical protein
MNRISSCLAAAALVAAAGCGSSQKSTLALVPAVGKVTVDGAPLPEALVEFIPSGDTRGQGGTALTDDDGGYEARTPFGERGLPAGEYKVVISKRNLPEPTESGEAPPASVGPEVETLASAYSDPKRTTLKANVPPNGEAVNNFALQGGRKRVKK